MPEGAVELLKMIEGRFKHPAWRFVVDAALVILVGVIIVGGVGYIWSHAVKPIWADAVRPTYERLFAKAGPAAPTQKPIGNPSPPPVLFAHSKAFPDPPEHTFVTPKAPKPGSADIRQLQSDSPHPNRPAPGPTTMTGGSATAGGVGGNVYAATGPGSIAAGTINENITSYAKPDGATLHREQIEKLGEFRTEGGQIAGEWAATAPGADAGNPKFRAEYKKWRDEVDKYFSEMPDGYYRNQFDNSGMINGLPAGGLGGDDGLFETLEAQLLVLKEIMKELHE